MIVLELTRKDSVFVAQQLRTLRLSPVPVDRCSDAPDYRWQDGEWERVVERYPWGAVLYVDCPTAHATVVAVGVVDVRVGTVIDASGQQEALPLPWYAELARRAMVPEITIPQCAGYWVSGVTCDGGANETTKQTEDACGWRRRCRLIQAHLLKLDVDPGTYVRRYGPDALKRLLERLDKSSGASPATPVAKKPVKRRKTRRKKSATPQEKRTRRYAPLRQCVDRFCAILSAELLQRHGVYWCAKRTAAVRAGAIYAADRTETNVYVTLYLRRVSGRPYKLAVLRLAPINGGIDVQLPCVATPEGMPDGLRCGLWRDLPMRSVVRTMTTDDHYRWLATYLADSAMDALASMDSAEADE
jgi:hypothetical protein